MKGLAEKYILHKTGYRGNMLWIRQTVMHYKNHFTGGLGPSPGLSELELES